jgi:hypothetical protein
MLWIYVEIFERLRRWTRNYMMSCASVELFSVNLAPKSKFGHSRCRGIKISQISKPFREIWNDQSSLDNWAASESLKSSKWKAILMKISSVLLFRQFSQRAIRHFSDKTLSRGRLVFCLQIVWCIHCFEFWNTIYHRRSCKFETVLFSRNSSKAPLLFLTYNLCVEWYISTSWRYQPVP